MNLKHIILSLIFITTSLFAMHPLKDYTKCQQPYIDKLRHGDSDAFKKSIVTCRATLWNEDMSSYTSFNYKRFSAKALTCAGDVHSKEFLRGHKRSLKYATTFYRLAAMNGSEDAKVNLIYLGTYQQNVIFIDDTKEQYRKVFQSRVSTPTFMQIMDASKNIKNENRASYITKHQKYMQKHIDTCIDALKKDILIIEADQERLKELFSDMSAMHYDENGKLEEKTINPELERHLHVWGNVENRNYKAQSSMLKGALKEYQKIQRYMRKK